MKTFFKFGLLLSLFSILSCSTANEPVDPALLGQANLPGTNPGTGGTTNPTNPTAPTNLDYWPAALNNQWIYNRDGVSQGPTKVISINQINGQTYSTFNTQPGTSTTAASGPITVTGISRLRKNAGDYFLRYDSQTFTTTGISGTQSDFEFIILKDYLAVGQTWTNSYVQTTTYNSSVIPPVVANFTVVGTIIDKDVPFTVNGVPFTNVIKVKIEQTAVFTGIPTATTVNFYWFAKNIGLIKADNIITTTGTPVVTSTEVVSYIIN